MRTVCDINECTGCRACMNACPHEAIHLVDDMKIINAVIDPDLCVNCGRCTSVCPNNNPVEQHDQIFWWQGHAADPEIRRRSSSGGIATALISRFLSTGDCVCSCLFTGGKFTFCCTCDRDMEGAFAGSKYVKSDPGYVYGDCRSALERGQRLLFIGLPCQVAALKNYIPQRLQERLYTVDLICHGTPSIKLLELYLEQNGISMDALSQITFRHKDPVGFALRINERSISYDGTVDRYLISFLNAANYTEHCYSCQYATTRRVGDLTLGDSWGTDRVDEMRRGLSLITVQSDKGANLLAEADLQLYTVDAARATASNGNLHHPSRKPEKREWFFRKLRDGADYNRLIMRLYPRQCLRQNVKALAIRLRLKRQEGGASQGAET